MLLRGIRSEADDVSGVAAGGGTLRSAVIALIPAIRPDISAG
jgi:hypothetical protein